MKLMTCTICTVNNNNNNNNNIYLKSNIHSIIDTSSVDYMTAIKHGIHIKTAQSIIKNFRK